MTTVSKADIRDTPLSVDEAVASVRRPGAGGLAVFVGVVRDENAGRTVTRLEYSAYASMAKREMERIVDEIEAEIPEVRVAALHRTGSLEVGDAAVVCAASAPHRGEAFRACRELIDRIKSRVPIWKREIGPDGAAWVGWEDARCGPGHEHGGEHHDDRHHDHPPKP
jgi:molybdopterin synthase catalytic subunit